MLFKQKFHHSKNFEFLYNIERLKLIEDEKLRKHCIDLEILLKDSEYFDLNGIENFVELKILIRILYKNKTPIEYLDLV